MLQLTASSQPHPRILCRKEMGLRLKPLLHPSKWFIRCKRNLRIYFSKFNFSILIPMFQFAFLSRPGSRTELMVLHSCCLRLSASNRREGRQRMNKTRVADSFPHPEYNEHGIPRSEFETRQKLLPKHQPIDV